MGDTTGTLFLIEAGLTAEANVNSPYFGRVRVSISKTGSAEIGFQMLMQHTSLKAVFKNASDLKSVALRTCGGLSD